MADRVPCLVVAAFVFLTVLNLGPAFIKPGDIDLYMLDLAWQDSRTEIGQTGGLPKGKPEPSPVQAPSRPNAPTLKPTYQEPVGGLSGGQPGSSKGPGISNEIRPLADEAESRVKAVNELLKDVTGPIVVGGIGDSGTRGAAELLMHYGTTMGDNHMLNSAHDSMYFHHVYWVKLLKFKRLKKKSYREIGYPGISSGHSFIYNRNTMRKFYGPVKGDEKWFAGIQWIASMVSRSVDIC